MKEHCNTNCEHDRAHHKQACRFSHRERQGNQPNIDQDGRADRGDTQYDKEKANLGIVDVSVLVFSHYVSAWEIPTLLGA